MPAELIDIFHEMDKDELEKIIRRNTEWIYLTRGMLYYYGVLKISTLTEKIEELTKEKFNFKEFLDVLEAEKNFYGNINISIHGVSDASVIDEKEILEEQKSRPNIGYYPFTKNELLQAGKPGYTDKTPELNKLLHFIANILWFVKRNYRRNCGTIHIYRK